jgi:hypothetical protein
LARYTHGRYEPAAPSLLLEVSANGRYLQDGNGQPFLLWGIAGWNTVNENLATAETLSGHLHRGYQERFDVEASQGCTGTLIQLISRYQTRAPNNANNIAPFTTPDDFATFNPAYFAFAKQVIDYADTKGIVCTVAPAWMGYNEPQGWYNQLVSNGAAKCFDYGVAVANALGSCDNIIWCGAGDRPDGEAHSTTEFQALIDGIRSVPAGARHLWTHHWNFQPSDHHALSPTHINGCYSWGNSWDESGDSVDNQVATEYAENDGPCVVLETLYEHNTPGYTSRGSRAAIMQSMLRGAKGFFWGNEATWHAGAADAHLPSQSQGKPYDLATVDTLELRNCKTLFAGKAWHLLEPSKGAGQLLTSGSGYAAKTPSGSYAVVYAKSSVTIDRTKMAGSFSARWFDITTGSFTTVSGSPFPNTGTQTFDAPGTIGNNSRGEPDWAILLEAV